MLFVTLAVFFSVFVPGTGTKAIDCNDIGSCLVSISSLDPPADGDTEKQCQAVMEAQKCMEESMAYCQENGKEFPKDMMDAFQTYQKTLMDMQESSCKGDSTTDTGNGVSAASNGDNAMDSSADKCSDLPKCVDPMTDFESVAKDGDQQVMCGMLGKSLTCMKTALADCDAIGFSYPKEAMESLQMSMKSIEDQQNAICKGYTIIDNKDGSADTGNGTSSGTGENSNSDREGPPENVKCGEVNKCVFDMRQVREAIEEKRHQDACDIVAPSIVCLKSAIKDCRELDVMPEDQLQDLSQILDASQDIVKKCDGNGGIGLTSTSMFLALSVLMPFVANFIF